MNTVVKFTPPIIETSVSSKYETPTGDLQSATLLLKDSHGKLFALHVATEVSHLAEIHDLQDLEVEAADIEPTFILPIDSLDEQIIARVITGVTPDILQYYLIAQEEL